MAGEGVAGVYYDVVEDPAVEKGVMGGGTVHHIAFRTPDAEEQKSWRQLLVANGLDVTPVIDRKYFRSIYFREAGGVLFELATDPPGFAVDEEPGLLGLKLMLPSVMNPCRTSKGRSSLAGRFVGIKRKTLRATQSVQAGFHATDQAPAKIDGVRQSHANARDPGRLCRDRIHHGGQPDPAAPSSGDWAWPGRCSHAVAAPCGFCGGLPGPDRRGGRLAAGSWYLPYGFAAFGLVAAVSSGGADGHFHARKAG
jgi:hypothetical protein